MNFMHYYKEVVCANYLQCRKYYEKFTIGFLFEDFLIVLPNMPSEFHILCKLNLIILTAFS